MELFGLGGGFYTSHKVSFVFLRLPGCHSWINTKHATYRCIHTLPQCLFELGAALYTVA